MRMIASIISEPTTEKISLDEIKRHLRIAHVELDDEIAAILSAARQACEMHSQRTLRGPVERTLTMDAWWTSEADELWLPWPPVISVDEIRWNGSEVLDSGSYAVHKTATGAARIVALGALPCLDDRPDAVVIKFTTGYQGDLPPIAIQAIKLKCTELFGEASEGELRASNMAAASLLAMIDWSACSSG